MAWQLMLKSNLQMIKFELICVWLSQMFSTLQINGTFTKELRTQNSESIYSYQCLPYLESGSSLVFGGLIVILDVTSEKRTIL